MYVLNIDIKKVSVSNYVNLYKDSTYLLHLGLGHINKNKMSRMCKSRLIPHIISKNFNIRELDVKGK